MNEEKKYKIGWDIICVLAVVFFTVIGYPVTTWQYWVGNILMWTGGWCCLNMGMEIK